MHRVVFPAIRLDTLIDIAWNVTSEAVNQSEQLLCRCQAAGNAYFVLLISVFEMDICDVGELVENSICSMPIKILVDEKV